MISAFAFELFGPGVALLGCLLRFDLYFVNPWWTRVPSAVTAA